MSRSNGTVHRRAGAIAAALALAIGGVAWSGCGDDEDEAVDAANQAIEDAQQQAEETQGEVNEALENSDVEEATQDAEDAANQALEDAQQQAEDAQNQINDALGE
jgi:uncharacterized protein HemX